jgi:hypothetical protein
VAPAAAPVAGQELDLLSGVVESFAVSPPGPIVDARIDA